MTTSIIPRLIRERVARAVATIEAWNEAIAQARRMEAVAHQPGRYEYDLRYTLIGESLRMQVGEALLMLDTCEGLARANGLDPAALYPETGGRPALIGQGLDVQTWADA